MTSEATVYVVDDNEAMRKLLGRLVESVGLHIEAYATAHDFLQAYDDSRPGCLIADVRLPGMSGMDLQDRLSKKRPTLPIIVITGYGDVSMAVCAMKRGAFDFFEKPFDHQELLDRVQQAIELDIQNRRERLRRAVIVSRAARLTPREREVMNMVVAGLPNKAIASRRFVSRKTVEAHRASTMRKMQAESLPDLVRLAGMVAEESGNGSGLRVGQREGEAVDSERPTTDRLADR